jgi:hypothetical protein
MGNLRTSSSRVSLMMPAVDVPLGYGLESVVLGTYLSPPPTPGTPSKGNISSKTTPSGRVEWLYSPAQINEWFLRTIAVKHPDQDADDLAAIADVLQTSAVLFNKYDVDGAAELDLGGVMAALMEGGQGELSTTTVKELMSQVDDDCSGTLRCVHLAASLVLMSARLVVRGSSHQSTRLVL